MPTNRNHRIHLRVHVTIAFTFNAHWGLNASQKVSTTHELDFREHTFSSTKKGGTGVKHGYSKLGKALDDLKGGRNARALLRLVKTSQCYGQTILRGQMQAL